MTHPVVVSHPEKTRLCLLHAPLSHLINCHLHRWVVTVFLSTFVSPSALPSRSSMPFCPPPPQVAVHGSVHRMRPDSLTLMTLLLLLLLLMTSRE